MTATLEIAEKLHTVQEWLESEKHSEVRHEYYYGKLITMAGEARKANTVSKNLVRLLDVPLYQRGYEAFFLDVKAEVVPGGIYRYPDMVVTPVTDNADDYIVKQAILLAEVASEDSGYRDRVKKRKEYLKIPSLHYYLVISQDEMMIEFQDRKKHECRPVWQAIGG